MLTGAKTELKFLCASLLLVILCGWQTAQFSLCLSIFFVFYFLWHLRSAIVLFIWLDRGIQSPPPNLVGIWAELSSLILRARLKQVESIKRMRRAVKRTSQLTHAIDEGIVVLKKGYSLSWWNETAKALLGLQASDRGHSLTSLIREAKLEAYLSQKEIIGKIELPSRANPSKWLMLTASRYGDGEIALVISDISLLKEAERLRKEFVGNVSHELRTPITVLRGYLETLANGLITDDPNIQKACMQMSEQVLRMQDLADDLIVLSKLESQPEKIQKQKIELLPLINSIVSQAEIVSEGKHQFKIKCSAASYMMVQESDIYSAIENLIMNAIHHNPDGAEIEIIVDEDEQNINISVKDDGIGIKADDIPRLTERFYRTDMGRNSKSGGSGLGLAIVKHVVGRYNGNLEVISKYGEGAIFNCTFPKSTAR